MLTTTQVCLHLIHRQRHLAIASTRLPAPSSCPPTLISMVESQLVLPASVHIMCSRMALFVSSSMSIHTEICRLCRVLELNSHSHQDSKTHRGLDEDQARAIRIESRRWTLGFGPQRFKSTLSTTCVLKRMATKRTVDGFLFEMPKRVGGY